MHAILPLGRGCRPEVYHVTNSLGFVYSLYRVCLGFHWGFSVGCLFFHHGFSTILFSGLTSGVMSDSGFRIYGQSSVCQWYYFLGLLPLLATTHPPFGFKSLLIFFLPLVPPPSVLFLPFSVHILPLPAAQTIYIQRFFTLACVPFECWIIC